MKRDNADEVCAGASIHGLLIACTMTLVGCTTLSLPDYQPAAPADYRAHRTVGSLSIAAEAMVDARESATYFGTNLVEEGVLPVLVVAANRGPKSFVLSRDRVLLKTGRSIADGASRSQAATDTGGAGVAAAGAVLMSPILQFSGFKMMSDAQVIGRNLAAKELQTSTLSPGETAHGFVYFRVTPVDWGDGWAVRIGLQELGSDAEATVEIPL